MPPPRLPASLPSVRLITRLHPRAAPHPAISQQVRNSSSEPHYDPPTGWLFGVPPGEKYKKEGWENIWMYGFFGSLLFGVVGYAFKEDTSIQTWALEEARRRLEAEGILPDPDVAEKR